MIYVTAMPHPKSRDLLRTTFVCQTCNQTRSYMLAAAAVEIYALDAAATLAPASP
jgi:hypothetical protein